LFTSTLVDHPDDSCDPSDFMRPIGDDEILRTAAGTPIYNVRLKFPN
jgi:hypothetical protein